MRRWIKWFAIDWINSTARDELAPAERATFVDFVCLAAFPGSPPGTFKVASWEALARKLNTPLPVVLSTRDKCLPTRITVENSPEGIHIGIRNWPKYQTVIRSDLAADSKKLHHIPFSDNETSSQRRGEERRGRREREKKETPPLPSVFPSHNEKGGKEKRKSRAPLQLTDAFRQSMLLKFGNVLGFDNVHEIIEDALSHKAVNKWKSIERYVQNWLRKEAERYGSPQRHPAPIPPEDAQVPQIPSPFAKYR